jgi:hypothetical protein
MRSEYRSPTAPVLLGLFATLSRKTGINAWILRIIAGGGLPHRVHPGGVAVRAWGGHHPIVRTNGDPTGHRVPFSHQQEIQSTLGTS